MSARRLLWTLAVAAGLAGAQEQPKFVQKLIEVKYADAGRIWRLIQAPGVSMHADEGLHVIVAYGTAEAVAGIEEMVKKLDAPAPNIELTVYLVSGSAQNPAEDLPKDLVPAAKQLHALFPYKGYRVIESFVMRGRAGREANTSGALPGTNSYYDFRYRAVTVSSGTPRLIHIDGMSLSVRVPFSSRDKEGKPATEYRNVGINTDIDAAEGQKIVVGKSSINGTDDALILIVTAKVLE
jgi:hypothetical protein